MEDALIFKSSKEFEKWLDKNHSKSNGIWLKAYKKGHKYYLNNTEILDALLSYGWITGPAKYSDEKTILWWVCPRRKKSLWSEINKGHAERLIREGRMRPSGMREIEAAKADGRWDRAYAPQRTAVLPNDFVKELNKSRKAKETIKTWNRTNVYAIIFRLHNTKDPELRKEKIRRYIKMLEEGKRFH